MSNLSDDEINRRIAEIEGWAFTAANRPGWSDDEWTHPDTILCPKLPPPYATDWAFCGPLVNKYKLDLAHEWDGENDEWGVVMYRHGEIGSRPWANGPTPQRAICLAIIASEDK